MASCRGGCWEAKRKAGARLERAPYACLMPSGHRSRLTRLASTALALFGARFGRGWSCKDTSTARRVHPLPHHTLCLPQVVKATSTSSWPVYHGKGAGLMQPLHLVTP